IRVASVVDPSDYPTIVSELKSHDGAVTLGLRYRLARKAFDHTAVYDRTIADYLGARGLVEVERCYNQ
ncbi:MAG: hypothetical protein P8X85_20775, partial [Desulfobacterales bacterium]